MSFIILFIIILAILVFVHELGHFVVARRNGVKAEEFGFGFPPRFLGVYKKNGKWKFSWGRKEIESDDTIYSLNWIPLGGFVKIKGEDGEVKDSDSFASKSAWVRIKILSAGVLMNFFLAWMVIWLAMMIGVPEAIQEGSANFKNSKIQIAEVIPESPAQEMGFKIGDEIEKKQAGREFKDIQSVQDFIRENKGKEISLLVKRGSEVLELRGTPRIDFPANQGPLGVALAETGIVKYSFFEGLWKSLLGLLNILLLMLSTLFLLIKQLILGQSVSFEVSGPVGIAVMTKQVASLGLVYVLQFAALISANLGLINILPIPALDGGRILFILIEKIKRSPVSQKTEQAFHTIGFMLLIGLMILVTFRDIWKLFK
ncbi:MAG: RIP metalloprotease RseP [Patescibacteria group bacterium]